MGFLLKGYNDYFGDFRIISMDINSQKDYEIYKSIITDSELMKTSSLFNKKIPTEQKARKDFELKTKSNDLYNIGFGKILDSNDNVLGITGLIATETQNEKPIGVEIGYFIKKESQNKKLCSDTTKLLIQKLFLENRDIKYILSTTWNNNLPSIKILEKNNFTLIKEEKEIRYYILSKNQLTQKENIKRIKLLKNTRY